jgi:hypothetical protein
LGGAVFEKSFVGKQYFQLTFDKSIEILRFLSLKADIFFRFIETFGIGIYAHQLSREIEENQ